MWGLPISCGEWQSLWSPLPPHNLTEILYFVFQQRLLLFHETLLSCSLQATLFNNHNGYRFLMNSNYLHWFLHEREIRSKLRKTKNHIFLLWEMMPQWCLLTKMLGRAPEESSTHHKVSEYSHSRGKRVISIPQWPSSPPPPPLPCYWEIYLSLM
jgi:hypothetical protein